MDSAVNNDASPRCCKISFMAGPLVSFLASENENGNGNVGQGHSPHKPCTDANGTDGTEHARPSICGNPARSALTWGGTKTLFALYNERFEVLEEIKLKTEGSKREAFTKTLKESVASLLKKASKHRLTVSAIGIGCAGSIDTQKGVVNSAPNIPALDGFSFNQALAKITDVNVRVSNDVHAALYGEHKLGAAVGANT